jgi:hypothetical protein
MVDKDTRKKRYRWNAEEERVSPIVYVCQTNQGQLRYSRKSVKGGVEYTLEYRGSDDNFSFVWGAGTKERELSESELALVRKYQGALGRSVNGLPQGLRIEGKDLLKRLLESSDHAPRKAPSHEFLTRGRRAELA